MSELPQGWASTSLGVLAQFEMGQAPPGTASNMTGEGTLFVKAGEFGRLKPVTREWTTDPKKFAKDGDVLICVVGATAGKLNLGIDCAIGRSVAAIRPSDLVLQKTIYFQLLPQVERLRAGTTGSAQGVISKDALAEIPFSLPPLPEQKRIADKLDTVLARVDACRDRLDRLPALLKRFRQSILAAATSGRLTEDVRQTGIQGNAEKEIATWLKVRAKSEKKPPVEADLSHWRLEAPPGWTICSVHQFAECLDRMRVPIKRELRKNTGGHYPYYGANGEVGRIDEFIFDDELVLVTEDETFYGREKPIAYRSSGKCWVNNHAHVLRAPTKAANDYLCFALMYYDILPWLSGTTGRAKLTQQALNALPIACPPANELEEIVRRVEILFAFADRLEARLATARKQVEQLTPALLAKAFRGELVAQDPADEPAAELLKRLAAKRAAAPQSSRGRKTASSN